MRKAPLVTVADSPFMSSAPGPKSDAMLTTLSGPQWTMNIPDDPSMDVEGVRRRQSLASVLVRGCASCSLLVA